MSDEHDRLRDLDKRLAKAVRPIRVLSTLSWPESAKTAFVSRWKGGELRLPSVSLPRIDLDHPRALIQGILHELGDHPLDQLLRRNAESWHQAADMLTVAGTPVFTERSSDIYGHPRQRLHAGAPTHLDVALHFLQVTEGIQATDRDEPFEATRAAEWLQAGIAEVMDDLPVQVDPSLSARATAGSKRVRLRGGARYERGELEQLLQHEALIHSLTARNGKDQTVLKSLGLGTPRTTCTQEGLATFAELITDTMAVHRLRRIALRVVAIDAALQGADFLDVFRIFREAGEDDAEACHSASRVFRGGDVRGRIAFTKDVVYLKGALHTHAFLLTAQKHGRGDLVPALFCGRLTWDDAAAIAPFLGEGIDVPQRMPRWAANASRLAAFLTWSVLHRGLDLAPMTLGDFD